MRVGMCHNRTNQQNLWKTKGIRSMDFTHDEAAAETPVSACNVTLSVAPTVRMICALGVTNFINYAKGGGLRKFIQMDAFDFVLDAF